MALRVDTKAIFLAGFVAAIAQYLAAQRAHIEWLTNIAFGAYAISFAIAIGALAIGKYDDLNPRALFDLYATQPRVEVLRRLCAYKAVSYERNARKYRIKARLWWASCILLTAGVVFSVLSLAKG